MRTRHTNYDSLENIEADDYSYLTKEEEEEPNLDDEVVNIDKSLAGSDCRHTNYGSLQNIKVHGADDYRYLTKEEEEEPYQDDGVVKIDKSFWDGCDCGDENEEPETVTFENGYEQLEAMDRAIQARKSKVKSDAKRKRVRHLEKYETQKRNKLDKMAAASSSETHLHGGGKGRGGELIPDNILRKVGAKMAADRPSTEPKKVVTKVARGHSHLALDRVYEVGEKGRRGQGPVVVTLPKSEYDVAPLKPSVLEYRRERLLFNVPSMPRVSMKEHLSDARKLRFVGYDKLG